MLRDSRLADVPAAVTSKRDRSAVEILVLQHVLHPTAQLTLDVVLYTLLGRVGERLGEPVVVGPRQIRSAPRAPRVALIILVEVAVPTTVIMADLLGLTLRLDPVRGRLVRLAHGSTLLPGRTVCQVVSDGA